MTRIGDLSHFRRRVLIIGMALLLVVAAASGYWYYQIYPHSWLPFDQSHTYCEPDEAQLTLRCIITIADHMESAYAVHFRRARVYQNGPGPSWNTIGDGFSSSTGRGTGYSLHLGSLPTPSGIELEVEWFGAGEQAPEHIHERIQIPVNRNLHVKRDKLQVVAAWNRT